MARKQQVPSEADVLEGVLAQIKSMSREDWLDEISWYRQMVADTQRLEHNAAAASANGAVLQVEAPSNSPRPS